MATAESWRDKVFLITDTMALVRNADLLSFAAPPAGPPPPGLEAVGGKLRIPAGTRVRISAVAIPPASGRSKQIYVQATLEDRRTVLGWTFSQNLQDKFVNETLGHLARGAPSDKFGPTAAWDAGNYAGQIDLLSIVSNEFHVEKMAETVATPYFAMVDAARRDAIFIAINSGFRSYAEQEALFKAYTLDPAHHPPAAAPGRSNHQKGIALDIQVDGATGHPVYDWLARHATAFGFVRTVNNEPWHWEHRPQEAQAARGAGRFKLPSVVDTAFA